MKIKVTFMTRAYMAGGKMLEWKNPRNAIKKRMNVFLYFETIAGKV